jgi:microcystin-dependent protein
VVTSVVIALAIWASVLTSAHAQSVQGRCNWLSQVVLAGFDYPPVGTVDAHGQLLDISSHVPLYSLIGNRFGGSPETGKFGLPDLAGRAPDGLHYYLCTTGTFPSAATSDGSCNWLGQVVLMTYDRSFNNTIAADGRLLDTANHAGLSSLYGFKYGGSEATMKFGVPDLSGKAPPGLTYRVCTTGAYPNAGTNEIGRCNWLGQLALFGFETVPYATIPADGRDLDVDTSTALFSLFGTKFGGQDQTKFKVPNLRGKAPGGLHYRVCTQGAYPVRG